MRARPARFWRVAVAWTVVAAAVGTVAVSAALADGRVGNESTTNDGGAWLLNRSEDSVGHVNRVVGEISSVAGPFSGAFDVSQAPGVVVVTNRGAGEAVLIDTKLSAPGAPVKITADTTVHAVPNGVVAFEESSGRVWRFGRDLFGAVTDLDAEAPIFQLAPGGHVAVGMDGRILGAEPDGSHLWEYTTDGGIETTELIEPPEVDTDGLAVVADTDPVTAITLVGEVPVIAHASGQLVVGGGEPQQYRVGDIATLQQPSPEGDNVVVVAEDGTMRTVNLDTGDTFEVADQTSSTTIRPVVHRGCVWSVTTGPTVFQFCGRQAPLGDAGSDLKLVVVNDWVWVNDVNLGGIWFVQEDDLEVREVSEWTAALLLSDETDVDPDAAGGDEEIVNSADADELLDDIDALDDDELNTPPVATDDRDATRRGRAVAVDVLANDSDDDHDPLSIDELLDVDVNGFTGNGARVSISADSSVIQVVPDVDFVGEIRFRYIVHDGRQGRDEASVVVTVTEPDPTGNRPPVTEIDNGTVRAGESVGMNVLSNDSDPDGDVLVLVDADEVGGTVNFTPDGELQFTPDISSPEGAVDIGYRVVDDFGAEANGTARIRVRPADSNQPPQARNDIGHTAIGHSVTLNALGNDSDPDGDPLVAQNLQSIDGTQTTAKLSPDGTFLFRPEAAGTYRFTYVVSDGPTVDEAQIRITVDPETDNRPPVAMVDQVALAIGESRLVRVLDNDGDPDGDVVGLVDWVGADGLDITEVPGVGFYVSAMPSANSRTEFRYWISDGLADPVMGTVLVSALSRDAVDYPPIAVVDTVSARPGSTTTVYVLRNDYDPEGRVLEIVGPVAQPPEARVRVAPDRQSLLLTVNADQQFSFRFTYDIADPAGNRGSAVVQVRVVPPTQANRAPIAGPDVASTPHATPTVVPVLLNDVDPDGDPIAVESVAEQPAHGTVVVLPDGNIQYTPVDGFSGTDRFAYTLVDGYQPPLDETGNPVVEGGPARDIGEVLIGVMPKNTANRPPIAVDDGGFAPVAISTGPVELDVLNNDSDPDNDALVVVAVTTPSVGTATVSQLRRSVVYTPPEESVPRVVAFSYTISDGRGGTASAQVTIDLAAAPDPIPPVAVDDQIGPAVARSTVVIDPRLNDLDPDGDVDLLHVLVDDPALTVLPDGQLEITVPTSSAELEYRVRDEQGLESEPAYLVIIVAPNQAPIITPIAVETPFDTPIVVDIHEAVVDPDQDPLVISIGNRRTGGSAQVVGAAERSSLEVEFTPDTGFEGAASFDYVVDDLNGHTVTGQVSITVLPPENREPVATDTTVTVEAGIDGVVRLADLVTDEDGPDEHVFTTSNTSGPIQLSGPTASGDVIVSSGVTSGGNTAGFDYTLTDGPYTVVKRVTIDLVVANFPPPTLGPDTVRTLQGQPTAAIRVLDNDVDNSPTGLAGDGLVVTNVGVSPGGSAVLGGDTITFTPTPEFFGTATFTYTVQDGRRAVQGESSTTVTVDVIGRPATPQAPSVASVGNRYVVVGWRAPAGDAARAPVTGYVLRYSASDGTTGEIRFDQPTTTYRWDGLANAVEYCFTVAAANEAGDGEFSEAGGAPSCGSPDIRPEAPSAPIVEFDDSQLHVSWQTPLNEGSAIRNYQVRVSGGLQELSPTLGVTNTYTQTDLDNGTDYTFEVRAQNGALDNDGWSDWSPLSSPEHPLTVPDAPAQPTAQRGDRQVRVTWQAPYDGGDAIQRYQVRSSLNSTWVDAPVQGQTNTYLWENIPNGTDVSFEVRAINRDPASTRPANTSPPSPTVRTCSVPDAPATPTAVRGDTQAVISWTPPDTQGCAITEYRITNSAGAPQTAAPGATSHAFTGLTNGTSYTFTVTAINEVVTVDGVAPKTSPASNAVVPAGPPFATNVTEATNVAPRQVRVSWNAANGNGTAVVRYEISVNGGAWSDVGNVTTITRSEQSNGATYSYVVRAVNDVAPGPAGGSQSATTWTYPGNPTVSASPGNGSVSASWTAPSNGGTGLTGHQAKLINASNGCGSGGTTRSNPGSPETWSSVSNGTTYRVCVRYSNAVGWGAWGSATATPQAPPRSVTAVWGGSAQGRPGCSVASCKYLNGTGYNFSPGSVVGVECWANDGGSWYRWSGPYNRTVAGNGTVSFGDVCYYGYTGSQARLRIAGVNSNAITN